MTRKFDLEIKRCNASDGFVGIKYMLKSDIKENEAVFGKCIKGILEGQKKQNTTCEGRSGGDYYERR